MNRPIILGAIAGAAFALAALPAAAQSTPACPLAKAEGEWKISGTSRAGILRVVVAAHCGALAAVPPGGAIPAMPSEFEVEVFGTCPEKECTWGKVAGRLERRDRIVVRVDQGFAVRSLVLTLSGDRLNVRTWTDYVDARDDFAARDRLTRLKRS